MDRKFGSDNQWYVSPIINLRCFKEEAIQSRHLLESMADQTATTSNQIGGAERKFSNFIKNDFSMINFVEDSSRLNQALDELDKDSDLLKNSQLQIHKGIRVRDEYLESNRQRKSAYISSLKYDRAQLNASSMLSRKQAALSDPVENDIVITVDCLSPYNRILSTTELRSSRVLRAQTKFILRGENFLFDLRKQLVCNCDMVVPLEDGRELEPPNLEFSTAELYPSSFIFIHDTFYVDLSNPKSNDTSLPIREFMSKKQIFDPVNAVDMADVKIIDLNLRLGQAYVFQHSGTCEHLLIFHDLRLMHQTDQQSLSSYPIPILDKTGDKKCEICHRTIAAFVVEQSELLSNVFVYFCRECFREFNFTNGVKTNSFKAWPIYEIDRMKM